MRLIDSVKGIAHEPVKEIVHEPAHKPKFMMNFWLLCSLRTKVCKLKIHHELPQVFYAAHDDLWVVQEERKVAEWQGAENGGPNVSVKC